MAKLPFLALAGALALASCASAPELEELDRLQRTRPARTIALEERFTLWSPFDLPTTAEWIDAVGAELFAVEALFEDAADGRVLVQLTPVEGLGPRYACGRRAEVDTAHPMNGVAGQSWGSSVNVFVAAPRKGVRDDPRGHRGTLRHELAHACSTRAGLDGADWYREGIAQYVESLDRVDGQLKDVGAPVILLARARQLPPEERRLERLLAWDEDGERILAGEERVDFASRTLCGLFVRFLIESRREPRLVERLRAVGEMDPINLKALDAHWQAWLDGPGSATSGLAGAARRSTGS